MEVDMHIHTIASDGTFTPEEVVKRVKSFGMKTLAITDHDTVDGLAEGKKTADEVGIEFIQGIEISCNVDNLEVHILGYFLNLEDEEFLAELEELKKAREIAPEGVIGFNIMVATRDYALYVKEAVKAGADIIISGAGLPVDLPEFAKGSATTLDPIVSSAQFERVNCRLWDRKYKRVPDMVVIEGPLAGGHLGFSTEELHQLGADTDNVPVTYKQDQYDQEVKAIQKVTEEFGKKYQKKIPLVTAGGIYEHKEEMGEFET